MPENLLDQIIRQKLEFFQVPFQEQHWSDFVRDSLAPDISHSLSDSFFQETLSSLIIPPSPGDWELFEQLLPVDAPVISMAPDETPETLRETVVEPDTVEGFPDNIFQQKLLHEELPLQAGDWEIMASQLDGNLFDQAIRSRLHSYTLPVGALDWYDMSSHIDAPMYATFKDHLGDMEVSYSHSDWRLFSRQWLGHYPWYREWRNLASIAAVLLLLFSSITPAFFTSYSNTPLASVQNPQESNQELVDSETRVPDYDLQATSPSVNHAPTREVYTPPYLANGNVTGSVRQVAPALSSQEEPEVLGEFPVQLEPLVYPQEATIQKIKPRKASWNDIGLPTKAPYWTNWFTPKTHLYSLSIGPYASFGKTRAELSSTYGTPGYTAGLRVEMGLTEEVSLITGLQYERRGFSHRFYAYTPTQQSIENIIDADMQLAEIPLLIRYYVPTAPKVRMYGQTGIITMVSLKEEYQLYQNTGSIAPLPGPEGRNLRLADPTGGQQRSLETYIGNIYGGIGISVQATERIFLEAEPFLLLSLQKTKGSGALGVEKRMYHGGVGFSVSYQLK